MPLPKVYSFLESYYLSNNLDVAASVVNGDTSSAEAHFNVFGNIEGRQANPFFNEDFYRANNPDVVNVINDGHLSSGFEHFLSFGLKEGRLPSAGFGFNESLYLSNNPDVAAAVSAGQFASGLEHFFKFGLEEGRFNVTTNSTTAAVEVGLITAPTNVTINNWLLLASGDPGASLNFDLSAADQTPLPGVQSGFSSVDFSNITGNDGHGFVGTNQSNNIIATSGNDTIQGGVGADIITGGAGSDRLVLNQGDSTSASGAAGGISWDVVLGFTVGSDKLAIGNNVTLGNFSFTDVNVTTAGLAGASLTAAFTTLENLVRSGGALELDAGGVAAFRTNGVGNGFDNNLFNASFAFIDENNVTGWQAGTDTVIQLFGVSGPLAATDFIA